MQELAESMVAFMTTEPPLGAVPALADLTAPELAAAETTDTTELVDEAMDDGADERSDDEELDAVSIEATADEGDTETAEIDMDGADDEDLEVVETVAADDAADEHADDTIDDATDDDDEERAEIAFVDYVIEPADEAAPELPEIPAPAPAPPSFHDMMAAPSADEFGGVPVVDEPAEAKPTRMRVGLFGRATDDEQVESAGLFGAHGARLIEQTSPEDLAAALADEDAEDERFRSFIDGDDGADKSRDWLLRNEQH